MRPARRFYARYCSPDCGRGCTFTEYEKARHSAELLAYELGEGWVGIVHENLGWWYYAVSPCGRIKVRPPSWEGGQYVAFLGEKDSPGGNWAESGGTPKEAVDATIKKAKEEVQKLSTLIEGL